jgi:transaldolase/glucose-6-phosphate isomerase
MQKMDKQGSLHFSAGDATEAITKELDDWQNGNKVQRLLVGDATLWTGSDENKWMGWLDVAAEDSEVPRIEALAREIKAAGFTDIVVLGMGGSSLCPAMMAETFGKIANNPRLHILDSTDPLQIRHLEEKINLETTFFIVSSKSGSTLEPNIFKEYFYARVQTALNKANVGAHFAAITDPGSALEKIAQDDHFKAIFHGVPSIGGRYSALSNFGMVPSGLMGVDAKIFLGHAKEMLEICSSGVSAKNNPGVLLGVILGVCERLGKNKVTLFASPGIQALGAWIEQLLAESTGKSGKGLIPVDQEPLTEPAFYSNDRVFVYIRLETEFAPEHDRAIEALEKAGFVVVKLNLPDKMYLGAELIRWEFATAVAGSIIGINPFNQPDVEASKVLALKTMTQYEQTGQLTEGRPLISEEGISLFGEPLGGATTISEYLRATFDQIEIGDYVDLSAFIEMSKEHTALLQQIRVLIRDKKKVATCLGFGPRFLHSTGQAYKGGPNTGTFLQITTDPCEDLQVPGHKYTFGVVIKAQAQADFEVLVKRSRRILRLHLGEDIRKDLKQLNAMMQRALQ